MPTVYIALGTNLGDRLENLRRAMAGLPPAADPQEVSPVYETPPWGIEDQPAFLNQVIRAETELPPNELLAYLKRLERELGRQKTVRYGPRLIDLDILFYDDLVVELPGLTIPHPRLAERAFVLVPLADLAPNLRHPITGHTVQELLEQTDTTGISLHRPAENS